MSNAFYKAHKVYGASRDYRIDSLHHTFVVFSNYRDKTHYPLGDAPNKFLRAETGYFETVAHYAIPSSPGSETVVYNLYHVEYFSYGKKKEGYLVHIFGLPIVYVNYPQEALDILATRHIAPEMTLPKVTIWGVTEDHWTFDHVGRYIWSKPRRKKPI